MQYKVFCVCSPKTVVTFCLRYRHRSHQRPLCLAACSRRRPTSPTTNWSPCTSQRPFWTETTACLRAQATTTWTPTTSRLTDDRVPGASELRSLSHSLRVSHRPLCAWLLLPKVPENCCTRRSRRRGQRAA